MIKQYYPLILSVVFTLCLIGLLVAILSFGNYLWYVIIGGCAIVAAFLLARLSLDRIPDPEPVWKEK